jgi:hypothetical protein
VKNPYLETFRRINGDRPSMAAWKARGELCDRYAWAIPCDEALEEIAKHGPIIEIGAGTGYWASLLIEMGVDVVAYDTNPPATHSNHFHAKGTTWTEVLEGSHEKVLEHPDRTLFLCWPPYDDDMALDCLRPYTGDVVLYIGEGEWGCTANAAFHTLLADGFEETATIWLPQYDGIHDRLEVWRRK